MCASFILGSLIISLKIFNALHVLVGLAITSYGCYLQIEYGTYVVTIVTLSVGGFITLLGCLGICAASKQNWCLLTTYSIFMALLFLVNVVILCMAFINYETLIGSLDSGNAHISKVKDELQNRKRIYQILQSSVVFVEFVCIWFSLMMRKHDGEILADGYTEFESTNNHSSNDFLLAADPQVNNQEGEILSSSQKNRQAMREKYGLDQ